MKCIFIRGKTPKDKTIIIKWLCCLKITDPYEKEENKHLKNEKDKKKIKKKMKKELTTAVVQFTDKSFEPNQMS